VPIVLLAMSWPVLLPASMELAGTKRRFAAIVEVPMMLPEESVERSREVVAGKVRRPKLASEEKRFVELAVVAKCAEEVAPPKMYTLPPTPSATPGLVVPMPKLPAAVKRAPSVSVPAFKVEKERSPFPAPKFCCRMEEMAAVVVPRLWVLSSVRNARETFADEVPEEKFDIYRGVLEADAEFDTSNCACGLVVPTPTKPVVARKMVDVAARPLVAL